MKLSKAFRYTLIFFSLFLLQCDPSEGVDASDRKSSDAKYRVTFHGDWLEIDFPTHFPPTPHFSGLVGATHSSDISFWGVHRAATEGIESMAENGSKSAFKREIKRARDEEKAEFYITDGRSSFSAAATSSIEFDISTRFPLVTVVSMVAPSPDWFVGVHDASLYQNEAWVERKVVEAVVYDAGTDSGSSFTSANRDDNDVITLLTTDDDDSDFDNGVHRDSGRTIGRFVFEKI